MLLYQSYGMLVTQDFYFKIFILETFYHDSFNHDEGYEAVSVATRCKSIYYANKVTWGMKRGIKWLFMALEINDPTNAKCFETPPL